VKLYESGSRKYLLLFQWLSAVLSGPSALDFRRLRSGNDPAMNRKIESAIARLPQRSRRELLSIWEQLFGRSAPAGVRRELLIPCLAYRLQEQVYGGPTSEQEWRLRRASEMLHPGSRTRLQPGTRIQRRWRDEMHEVLTTQTGYEYRGVCYKSLSVIARRITQTRWSGPAFFGLKKNRRSENPA
jgi:DUF2924 family protein